MRALPYTQRKTHELWDQVGSHDLVEPEGCENFAPAVPAAKTIVLDANIPIRAVLGRRVLGLLIRYASLVRFVAPKEAFASSCTWPVDGLIADRPRAA